MADTTTRQAAKFLQAGDFEAALQKYLELKARTQSAAWDYQIRYARRQLAAAASGRSHLGALFFNLKFTIGIDHVYVLNLPHRTDRKARTFKELTKAGFAASDIEFVAGLHGDRDERAKQLARDFKTGGDRPNGFGLSIPDEILAHDREHATPGVFGYLLSQSIILRDALAHGYERILVLDDDVFFSSDAVSILKRFAHAKKNWKLLLLGASNYFLGDDEAYARLKAQGENLGFYHPIPLATCGSFAVCYDKEALLPLLELIDSHYGYFDRHILACLYTKYHHECYALWPSACGADITESDIRESRDVHTHAQMMGWDTSRLAEYQSS
jgi:GR25 family glycosyltransferase involved in LPS biosynthesis